MTDMEEHFTKDDDRLGRFVLGTMPEDERFACEEHLRRCEICQQAVREERKIAAGIKRYGRDRMKERLRAAVGAEHRTGMSWQQFTAVAATIAIIAGAGILYRWWEAREEGRTISEFKKEESSRTERPSLAPSVGEERGAPSAGADASSRDDRKNAVIPREQMSNAPARTEPSGEIAAAAQSGKGKQEHVGVANELAIERRGKESEADKLGGIGGKQQSLRQTQTFWVQGVPMSTPVHSGPAPSQVETAKKDVRDEGKAAAKALGISRTQTADQEFVVQQRPADSLPESGQQQAAQKTIATEVLDSDTRTILTLYLDTLLDAEQLRNARVWLVGSDSLIVEAGGKTIGYRMPKGWLESRTTKTTITH